MKLWYSTTSPYVRKVLVTLKYQQLLDKTELIKIGSSLMQALRIIRRILLVECQR